MINQLITLLIFVLIVGVIYWAIVTLIPIPQPFLKVAQVIAVIILLLLILSIFFGGYHMPIIR